MLITATGLNLTVPPFAKANLAFPGGTLAALPSGEQYLVINRKTGSLHTLPRLLGDGERLLARVSTSEAKVTSLLPADGATPPSRLPRFHAKLRAGQPVSIACYGTSLIENGKSPDGWLRLLFATSSDSPLGLACDVRLHNHAVGGANARYAAALLGSAVLDERALSSPPLDQDLAIVGLLPNGGEDRLARFESVVRTLRLAGLEVLLVTDNASAGGADTDPLWADAAFVRDLATHYGCALADTAAYMREAELRGEPVYSDTIHQSPAGHRAWATAVAAVLTPSDSTGAVPPPRNDHPTLQPSRLVTGKTCLDFSPNRTGGVERTGVPANRLALHYGLPDGRCIDFVPGDRFSVSHPQAIAADLVFEASSSFTVEVREKGSGTVVKTITYCAAPGSPPWSIRPATRNVRAASDPAAHIDHEVSVASGRLRLYSVSYYTFP